MKNRPTPRRPEHPSYRLHRRQVATQVVIPVILGAAALIAAPITAWIVLMQGGGNVGRWASVSMMWILIPVIVAGVVLLTVVIALTVLTGYVHTFVPRYTVRAQRMAGGAAAATRRAAGMVRRPILAVRAARQMITDRFKQSQERV